MSIDRRKAAKVSLGVDYGTTSGRVLVLDLASGRELATAVVPYRHGLIEQTLPGSSIPLAADWVLQDPHDYLDVLHEGVPAAMRAARVAASQVAGIGVDFTSCTVLPVDARGVPLCFDAAWRSRPHAWPKLWKHRAAEAIADRMTEVAGDRGEPFLSRYGGRIAAEGYFPKLIQIFQEEPAVYQAMFGFIEGADWIVWYLTGHQRRNVTTAGFKALWSPAEGLPAQEYFSAVAPGFTDPWAKLGHEFFPLGHSAGHVRPEVANRLGISVGAAVAVGNADAPVAVPAVGVSAPETLVMVMGTSICHLTVAAEEVRMPGITGVVKDGVLPGWFGYDAGQAAAGDMLDWFTRTSVPAAFQAPEGRSLYDHLMSRARNLAPGESGLLALDWWSGNRGTQTGDHLTGVMVGMTLNTSVEARYRGLLESLAMGTRRIIENFSDHHIPILQLIACGGLAVKNPLLVQVCADVTGLPAMVPDSREIPARGAALFGAVAAGAEQGGFDSIAEASATLAAPILKCYHPDPLAVQQYNEIYPLYQMLHDHFVGPGGDLLRRLKAARSRRLRASNRKV